MLRRQLGQTFARHGSRWLFRSALSASLEPILVDFSTGIGCGLEGVGREELQRHESEIVWQRRSFFREGYAFALAARSALAPRRGSPELRNRGTTSFRILHFTGYGFWNGCAETLHLPRVSEDARSWNDVADFSRWYPFLVGGRAFGRLARAHTVTSALIRSFESERQPIWTEAAWHGCGRAFWFRAAGQPEALVELLGTYPAATKAMTFGLGFAMTYTQIASPAAVVRSIRSMPERSWEDLRVGAGVALGALTHEIPAEADRVRSLYQGGELGPYFEAALEAERASTKDAQWYATFREHLARAPVIARTPAIAG